MLIKALAVNSRGFNTTHLSAHVLLQRAPSVFCNMLPELVKLLHSEDADLQILGAQLMAAGAQVQKKRMSKETWPQPPEDLMPELIRLSKGGPPKAAKAAVLAIAGLYDDGTVSKVRGR